MNHQQYLVGKAIRPALTAAIATGRITRRQPSNRPVEVVQLPGVDRAERVRRWLEAATGCECRRLAECADSDSA
jgi:hypothetical protein